MQVGSMDPQEELSSNGEVCSACPDVQLPLQQEHRRTMNSDISNHHCSFQKNTPNLVRIVVSVHDLTLQMSIYKATGMSQVRMCTVASHEEVQANGRLFRKYVCQMYHTSFSLQTSKSFKPLKYQSMLGPNSGQTKVFPCSGVAPVLDRSTIFFFLGLRRNTHTILTSPPKKTFTAVRRQIVPGQWSLLWA